MSLSFDNNTDAHLSLASFDDDDGSFTNDYENVYKEDPKYVANFPPTESFPTMSSTCLDDDDEAFMSKLMNDEFMNDDDDDTMQILNDKEEDDAPTPELFDELAPQDRLDFESGYTASTPSPVRTDLDEDYGYKPSPKRQKTTMTTDVAGGQYPAPAMVTPEGSARISMEITNPSKSLFVDCTQEQAVSPSPVNTNNNDFSKGAQQSLVYEMLKPLFPLDDIYKPIVSFLLLMESSCCGDVRLSKLACKSVRHTIAFYAGKQWDPKDICRAISTVLPKRLEWREEYFQRLLSDGSMDKKAVQMGFFQKEGGIQGKRKRDVAGACTTNGRFNPSELQLALAYGTVNFEKAKQMKMTWMNFQKEFFDFLENASEAEKEHWWHTHVKDSDLEDWVRATADSLQRMSSAELEEWQRAPAKRPYP